MAHGGNFLTVSVYKRRFSSICPQPHIDVNINLTARKKNKSENNVFKDMMKNVTTGEKQFGDHRSLTDYKRFNYR